MFRNVSLNNKISLKCRAVFNNKQNLIENQKLDLVESISIENSSIVETLFIEESQIDEYLSLYVINEVIDD